MESDEPLELARCSRPFGVLFGEVSGEESMVTVESDYDKSA